MTVRGKRLGAVLLASALAFTVAADAQARGGFGGGGGGFGGGGMRMGGGGFGGGGMRMGGGSFGGGMRMGGGGFGGGGMRMGSFHVGGGSMHFGGSPMRFGGGGMRFGGSHLGGFHTAGRGLGAGRSAFHVGGRGSAHSGLGAHTFAGSTARGHGVAGQSFAGRNAGRAAAAAGVAHLGGRNFAQNGFAHNGFAHNGFNRSGWWHGPFPHPNAGFRVWWGFGWYGPVFWPFAYDVIFADLFWPWAYAYPFWDYGYPDIYAGLFWPYGYDDFAGYIPPGPGPIAGTYAGASRPVAGAAGLSAPSRTPRAAVSRQAEVTSQLNQSCGEDSKEVANWPIDRIEQVVTPTADQRALIDDFSNASLRAAQAIKEACPTTISFVPTGRMDAMQKRIAGMVQAIDIVRPPLDKFYNSLTEEQKARLDAASDQTGKNRSLAACGAASTATQWPGERIQKAVQPTGVQQAKLDALKTAMADAADALSKACPASLPTTPPARLDAISMRLNTMLQSVSTVRAALDDFYNSLSDEQKAQFNRIGRQQQTAQGQG